MSGSPPLAREGRWFRVAAVAEALTWFALLAAMIVKYIGSGNERGVEVFGPIHGVVVLAYFAVLGWASHRLRWDSRTTMLGVLASVPPGATLVFEAWAQRTFRLAAPADRRSATIRR